MIKWKNVDSFKSYEFEVERRNGLKFLSKSALPILAIYAFLCLLDVQLQKPVLETRKINAVLHL